MADLKPNERGCQRWPSHGDGSHDTWVVVRSTSGSVLIFRSMRPMFFSFFCGGGGGRFAPLLQFCAASPSVCLTAGKLRTDRGLALPLWRLAGVGNPLVELLLRSDESLMRFGAQRI